MTRTLTRVADRLLAKVAPRIEAAAGCSYVWETCGCINHLLKRRRCMRGCPGVPNHCYSCVTTSTC
jgi:hypothetical protein